MARTKVNGTDTELPSNKPVLTSLRERGMHMPGMCLNPELAPYGGCRLCLMDSKGKVVTACSTFPADNDEFRTMGDDLTLLRRTSLELMLSDHYGDCIGPCQKGCPTHSDVQGYLALVSAGKFHEAVKLMKEKYILPAVLGRVCPAFCEAECRRNLVEGAVGIRQLKRFAADMDLKDGAWMPSIPSPTGRKVAVIGGGPAGLACAFYLRTMGHSVTLYEAMDKLGGWTRYGIPEYRLPKDILDSDIATVIGTGIEVKLNTRIGKDVKLEKLVSSHDSVFLGIGAWTGRKLKAPGEALPGVYQGIDLLARLAKGEKVDLGKKVVVVGGGNTAMDVVRTCRRLGCEVTLTYRRSENEMPAAALEREEAKEEGVKFMLLCNPVRILGKDKVEGMELLGMELGEPDESGRRKPVPKACSEFTLPADSIVLAIGQYNEDRTLHDLGVGSKGGNIDVNALTLQTSIDGVFAGGDAVLGPSTVIESIEQGRRAALMMDLHMKGKMDLVRIAIKDPAKGLGFATSDPEVWNAVKDLAPYNHWKEVTEKDYLHVDRLPRQAAEVRPARQRVKDWKEVELTYKKDNALLEVKRCMSCGCMDAFECKLRLYSTQYGAKQDTFKGELTKVDLDSSHPHIQLDNNKCVLCGQCVNLTQEVTREGVVDFNFRGFATRVIPAMGEKLGDCKGNMLGDMIDVCPTGAFTEKLPYEKPGPWDTRPMPGICNGCGLGCEMELEVYNSDLVRARGRKEGWNRGHLCDMCRFDRPWSVSVKEPMLKGMNGFRTIDWEQALSIVKDHMKDAAIILGGDTTYEEASVFIEFAKKNGMMMGSFAKEGVSTARYEDIPRAKRIELDADIEKYPVLKVFLNEAFRNGTKVVDSDPDLKIIEAPFAPGPVPTIVLHEGVNDVGLLRMGIIGIPMAKNYIFVGSLPEKLPGYTIVLGYGEDADLMLPYLCFAERDGSVTNSSDTKLSFKRARAPKTDVKKILLL